MNAQQEQQALQQRVAQYRAQGKPESFILAYTRAWCQVSDRFRRPRELQTK